MFEIQISDQREFSRMYIFGYWRESYVIDYPNNRVEAVGLPLYQTPGIIHNSEARQLGPSGADSAYLQQPGARTVGNSVCRFPGTEKREAKGEKGGTHTET